MDLKPIRTKKDYLAAMAEVDRHWDAPAKSPAADRLDLLTLLIEHYERKHYPIPDPDPIEFLNHIMENREMKRKDLEPFIGPRGRVADIMNRTRPLTLEMIRRLADGLKLPAEILIKPYPLRKGAEELTAA